MNHRLSRLAIAALAMASVAAGCGGSGDDQTAPTDGAGFPLTIDDCGRELVLEQPPERVLSIGTVASNMLHAAGAADRVVARAGEFGTAPAGEAGAAVAGAEILVEDDPATEVIIGSEVDFVYGYGLFNSAPDDLAAAGIESVVTEGYCGDHGGGEADGAGGDLVDVVLTEVERLGTIFGTTEAADASVAELRGRLDAVEPLDGGTVAIVYWFGADAFVYGGASMADAMVERAGLVNIFGDNDELFLPLSTEELLDADPDTILLLWGTNGEPDDTLVRDNLAALPGADDLSAVAGDRVVSLQANFTEPDVAAVDGIEQIVASVGSLPAS